MRRNKTIRIVLLAVIVAGCFLLFRSASATGKSEPSQESMKECCEKKGNCETEGRSLENLSRQFFSSI